MIDERFDRTPPDLLEVQARLENWGRWARARNGKGRALSAEGRYRPARGDHDERRAPSIEVDIFDAAEIDRAIAPAWGFPWRWSALLKAEFVDRVSRYVICRHILSTHHTYYEYERTCALRGLQNVLARRKRFDGMNR